MSKKNRDHITIDTEIVKKLHENGINYGEIMLYGKILSMSSNGGKCIAHNSYFAKILNTTERNVRRYLSSLKEKNFLRVYEIKKNGITFSRTLYPQLVIENGELIYHNADSIIESTDVIGGQIRPMVGQDCPEVGQDRPGYNQTCPPIDRTDLVEVGQNCPRGRTDSSNLLEDRFVQPIGGQDRPPDNIYNIYNRYYIRDEVADAPESYADAPLNGSAYAPPDSASLRNAKLTEEEIQELDFGGKMSNDLILDYTKGYFNDLIHQGISVPEAYNQIIVELADSGGFYGCKMEPLRKYMNHLVAIQFGD